MTQGHTFTMRPRGVAARTRWLVVALTLTMTMALLTSVGAADEDDKALAQITSPTSGEVIYTDQTLELRAHDANAYDAQWAVRDATCEANAGANVVSNTNRNDPYSFVDGHFSADFDISAWSPGDYCFVFNTENRGGNDRLLVWFVVAERPTDPETKDECKKGGWQDFGFRNQGQCIQFVNTGKDSR